MPEVDLETAADPESAPAPAPKRGRPLTRGDSVGRYVVLDRLGVGGMGEVFAAYDPQLDRKIAVKLLLPLRGGGPASEGPSRLLREAQAMAKLRHPNVVTVHDVGTHDDRVFVAMEYVEGGTLADWMSEGSDGRGAPHPWRVVLERFDAAGRGLVAAHAAKLVHRDFKPANVLLAGDGQVRVADFGLVRRTLDEGHEPSEHEPSNHEPSNHEPSDHEPSEAGNAAVDDDATLAAEPTSLSDRTPAASTPTSLAGSLAGSLDSLSLRMTQTGATLGTPAYMAPEQYRGGHIDARADQFSFCVALWEALYGQRPFTGDNLHTLMFAIERGAIREPPDDREVPAAIRRAITRGLASEPAQRWPDMTALLTTLRRDADQRRRRGIRLGLGLGVGLVGLVALVVSQLPEPTPPEPTPPCIGAEAAFGDALGQVRRDALADHFGAFEQVWARDMGDRLFPRLDTWASDWQREWTDACEATHVRGEQSADLLDRRMLCLDRRRRSFVGLVDALILADEALAKQADVLIDDLGEVEVCGDIEALMRVTPLPDDTAKVDAILRLEQTVERATRHYLAGEYAEARALLEPQREAIAQLGYLPLVAAFDHIDGRVTMEVGDTQAGETSLEHAFVTALAAGDDALAVEIGRSLAYELNLIDRPKDALRWLDIAKALVVRNGGDEGQLANLAVTRSQTLGDLGELAAAEVAAREAYDLLTKTGSDSSRLGDALFLLGLADQRAGRFEQAIAHVEQARAAWYRSIGPRHPRNSSALTLLGVASRNLGKYEDSQRYFEEVLVIKRATFGGEHREIANAMMNLATAYSDLGKLPEAILTMQRVLAMRRAAPETAASELGRTLVNLANMQRQAGRYADASVSIREGEALLVDELGEDHPDLVTVFHIHAELELDRGELVAADRKVQAALRIAELKFADNPILSEVRTLVARIELARGQPREAKRQLDLAFTLDDPDPYTRAQRDLALAKTLVALGQRDEGLAKAREAQTAFEGVGPRAARELAEVQRWLALAP